MSDDIRTSASALGGASIDGALKSLRNKIETMVIRTANKCKHFCDQAKQSLVSVKNTEKTVVDVMPQANAIIAKAEAKLEELISNLKDAIKMKENFRVLFGIIRPPQIPSVATNVMIFCILAFAESILNAGFFVSANLMATPIGSLTISFLISLTNIFVSCVAGFFSRWLSYGVRAEEKSQFSNVRALAWFLQIVYVVIIIFFHVSCGLIRAQESLTVQHSMAHYQEILLLPEATFLIIVGLCISFVSYYKSRYSFSDPIPGYSVQQKNINDIKEKIEDLEEDIKDELVVAFNNAVDEDSVNQSQHLKVVKNYNKNVEKSLSNFRILEMTIAQSESQLTAKISRTLDIYGVAGDDRYSNLDIKKYSSFKDYLDIKLPELLPIPENNSQQQAMLNEDKAKALERLSNAFATKINLNIGEEK